MSANPDAMRKALQALAGATPGPSGEPTTAEVTSDGMVMRYTADGQPYSQMSPDLALAQGLINKADFALAKSYQKPLPPPAAPPRAPPALATSQPVVAPDRSILAGGGNDIPGAVTHAMTGAGLPDVPSPSETPAPRQFQALAGEAPQDNGIPDAVRAYVAQQPSGPSAAEQELTDAQDQQRLLQLYAGLGHAGATIGAAIGHIPVDEGFWANLSRQTGQPVERLKQVKALREEEARQDPGSAENQRAREVYAQLLPEIASKPGWNSVTKADIPAFLTDARFRKQAAEQERVRGESRAMDEARLAETKRHNLVNESRPVGQPQGPAPKGEAFVAPGYTLRPGAKPSAFELGKFRDALAAQKQLAGDIKSLRALHDKHGTELGGDAAAQMGALVSDMKLKVKDLAALGALSGSDMALLEGQIADPTSLGSNIKALVGDDTTNARLGQFEQIINSALEAKKDSLGVVPVDDGATQAPGSFALDDSADMVDVVAPNGTQGRIPKAKLDAALKRGFRLAG